MTNLSLIARKDHQLKDHLREFVQSTGRPIVAAMVITSFVAVFGWRYTRAQLGGRERSQREGGFGISGLAVAVLGLAIARVVLLR